MTTENSIPTSRSGHGSLSYTTSNHKIPAQRSSVGHDRLRRSHHRFPAPANHLGVRFTRRSDPSRNAIFRTAKLWRGPRRFTHKQVERRLLRFSNGF